jgi:hypothetical protein
MFKSNARIKQISTDKKYHTRLGGEAYTERQTDNIWKTTWKEGTLKQKE